MVRLSELPDRVLINILRRRGYELARNGVRYDERDCCGNSCRDLDTPEFDEAEACFRIGDVAEALIWLERALPDTFSGLSDRAVPREARRP